MDLFNDNENEWVARLYYTSKANCFSEPQPLQFLGWINTPRAGVTKKDIVMFVREIGSDLHAYNKQQSCDISVITRNNV